MADQTSGMSDRLRQIIAYKHDEVAALKRQRTFASMAGMSIIRSVTVKTRNIRKPTEKVKLAPPATMRKPPIAGPVKRELLKIVEFKAMAGAINSRPTKL